MLPPCGFQSVGSFLIFNVVLTVTFFCSSFLVLVFGVSPNVELSDVYAMENDTASRENSIFVPRTPVYCLEKEIELLQRM